MCYFSFLEASKRWSSSDQRLIMHSSQASPFNMLIQGPCPAFLYPLFISVSDAISMLALDSPRVLFYFLKGKKETLVFPSVFKMKLFSSWTADFLDFRVRKFLFKFSPASGSHKSTVLSVLQVVNAVWFSPVMSQEEPVAWKGTHLLGSLLYPDLAGE